MTEVHEMLLIIKKQVIKIPYAFGKKVETDTLGLMKRMQKEEGQQWWKTNFLIYFLRAGPL